MKFLQVLAAALLCGAGVAGVSGQEIFSWSLLWSGSWEDVSQEFDKGTLHNRGELKLNYLPLGLTLRGQILDRRPLFFEFDPPLEETTEQTPTTQTAVTLNWNDPDKTVTHYLGGLYHKQTGSRLLYGALDEWGLSARIRNPWIRSPPYAENHKPLMADLKTTASSTKNDEAYLYLSSPFLNLSPNVKLRGFISAQTETGDWLAEDDSQSSSEQSSNSHSPEAALPHAFSGGMDLKLPNKTGLLLETFYTGATLPPTKSSSWFSEKPPLPERDFRLLAAGALFHNQLIAVSTDWAFSETFAWGSDYYGNLGVTVTPLLTSGRIARPLSVSLAVDGAGEKFVYRDGASHGGGFRTAVKTEWKGERSSLIRANTVLRAPALGEDFTRSSTGFYYRFPARRNSDNDFLRLTRISLAADRNADNPQKINDRLYGNIGFSINLKEAGIKTPLGVNFSGSVRGLASTEETPSPYPIAESEDFWEIDTRSVSCELIWSPSIYQFKTKTGYSNNAKNNEKWDFSVSAAVRFKHGRLSLKAATPDFPENWRFTISWRLEKGEK
ncbi:MAG: hypothetical protein LBU66_00895 [Treponema sp.]|jgi:hypothetical protein|nr:hypothetical protein [Treponema sp.]